MVKLPGATFVLYFRKSRSRVSPWSLRFTACMLVSSPPPTFHSQQYVKNVICRANDEAGNLRANHRLRVSLDSYSRPVTWPTNNGNSSIIYTAFTSALGNSIKRSRADAKTDVGGSTGGVIGLLSDLVTVPDPRIARALSHKRRAALSTVVVDSETVLVDFRRSGLYTGPVNFLPLSALRLEHENLTPLAPLLMPLLMPSPRTATGAGAAAAVAAAAGTGGRGFGNGGGGWEGEEGKNNERADLLPLSPETPAPTGFLGYAVRLLQLRPEHEPLRWTVLFALFVDLVVFETTEQVKSQSLNFKHIGVWYLAMICFTY